MKDTLQKKATRIRIKTSKGEKKEKVVSPRGYLTTSQKGDKLLDVKTAYPMNIADNNVDTNERHPTLKSAGGSRIEDLSAVSQSHNDFAR